MTLPDARSRAAPPLVALACTVLAIKLAAAAVMLTRSCGAMPNRPNDGFWPLLPYYVSEAGFALLNSYAALQYLVIAPLLASTVLPLWWTARHLGIAKHAYVAAVLAFALYPYLLAHVPCQLDTGLSIAVLIWAVGCTHRFADSGTPLVALIAALSLTVLVADRAQALVLIPWLFACGLWPSAERRVPVRSWLMLGAVLGLFLAGYAGLRAMLYGEPGLLTANGGYNLLVGHNDYALEYLLRYDVTPEAVVFEHGRELCTSKVDTRASLEGALRACAVQWLGEHPMRALLAVPLRLFRHLDLLHTTFAVNSFAKNALYTVPYALVLLGAIAATVRDRGRWTELPRSTHVFLWGIVFVYALPSLATLPLIRLRMHTEVYWMLLAASAWASWKRASWKRGSSPRPAA